jgi:predicted transcriptional regulator of viral defense system
MSSGPLIKYIKQLAGPFFTTRDVARISGKSLSTVSQGLDYLHKHGAVMKVYRGLWMERTSAKPSAFDLVPHLMPLHRTYVSFTAALHLHGIIEQVPQDITLASTTHTRMFRTALAAFSVHRIAPEFFFGFDWYRTNGGFLIADPEKALLDCLYLSGRKQKNFGHFPEMHFPDTFNFVKARQWAKKIKDTRLQTYVLRKLKDCELNAG